MTRALAFLVAVFLALPALAQSRHALVVGIDGYVNLTGLTRARNDAQAVHAALATVGFQSDLVLDADRLTLLEALYRLSERVQPGDEAVLFYAGHGVEIDGQNYLLPADIPAATPGQELLITGNALPVSLVLEQLQRRGARLSFLIIDACRDNPFPRQGTRSAGTTRGLARVDPPEGVFVLYSAGSGEAALDRLGAQDSDPNSVFTRVLLPRLTQPGMPLHQIAREVRSEVRDLARAIGHQQFPAVYDQTIGEPVLVPVALSLPQLAITPPAAALTDPCVAARADWAILGDTPSLDVLTQFLDTHQGACVEMADLAAERRNVMLIALAFADGFAHPVAAGHLADPVDAQDLVRGIQQIIASFGCYRGAIDGLWGTQSRAALRALAENAGLHLTSFEPDIEVVQALTPQILLNFTDRVCPLSCSPRHDPVGGECVLRTCPSGQVLSDRGVCAPPSARPQTTPAAPEQGQSTNANCFVFNGSRICN